MEGDSVHSSIERKLRLRPELYSVKDYISLICTAREVPKGYDVETFTHKDFLNYHEINTIGSIRPLSEKASENKTKIIPGQDTVYDIKALKYKGKEIYVKTDHQHNWEELNQKYRIPVKKPQRLYTSQRPIRKSKYDDLQSLRKFIPDLEDKIFYTELPYS